jgi:benzoate-CoA ligase|tara:strand:- start:6234 stop:7664 length:1431 start_codon:yes stop_codon:yes gene_type:complete
MNISERNNFANWVFKNTDPKKVFCVDSTGASITYEQLQIRVNYFASKLKDKYGVQPQQRIGILLYDTVNWPVAFLSCLLIGANPLLLYRNLLGADIKYLVQLADCKFVICTDENFSYVKSIPDYEIQETEIEKVEPYLWHKDEMCWWTLSSGSTGRHKLIVNTHGSFENLYNVANNRVGIKENDFVLCVAKMSFAWGLAQMMWVMSNNATIGLIKKAPAPSMIFKMIKDNDANVLCISPYVLNAMCRKKFVLPKHLKIISSGEHLTDRLRNKFKKVFGLNILDGYGTSEIWSAISIQQNDVAFNNMGSVIEGVKYKIVDENQKQCPPGTPGELYVSHPAQAVMYWKDTTASKQTFIGDWVRTGDIVIEKQSKLIYKGRKDDIVKIQGLFVSPIDIEEKILQISNVEQCMVIVDTEADVFSLVLLVKFEKRDKDNISNLRSALHTKLTTERIPKYIKEVEEFPRTVNNKMKRKISFA